MFSVQLFTIFAMFWETLKIKQYGLLPENVNIAPFDVRALFTNIPQEEGALATEEAFNEREIQIIPTELIVSMLQLILQNNIFDWPGVAGAVLQTASSLID